MTVGIFDISAADYHADEVGAPAPTLSASVLNTLLRQSPLHARAIHPKLGGYRSDDSETLELGAAAHAYILEGIDAFDVIEAHDYRTKAAQEQRDAARAAGRTPILARKLETVRQMSDAIRRQLVAFAEPPRPLSEGKPERTIVWFEEHANVWCRARIDWLRNDLKFAEDLKTGQHSSRPDSWIRTALYGRGMDVQAAFYMRGLKAVTGRDVGWRFIAAENEYPFATSVIGLGPAALDHAADKVEQGIQTWGRCLAANDWPGYPRRTCFAEPPAWEVAQQLEREASEEYGAETAATGDSP